MHPTLRHPLRAAARLFGRRTAAILATAAGLVACSSHNYNSGYGVVWVTVTAEPGAFASYLVNLDSVVLKDNKGNSYTALATVEPVDFARLGHVAELWGSGTVPIDTYVSATITLDYTNAAVSVVQNGAPQAAKVVGTNGSAVTSVSFTVKFDPNTPLVLTSSYATSNAERLALNFDLPASNQINTATSPATVTVDPFMTAGIAPADTKLIRIRGPLINSSVGLGTYTVYERPFTDEASNIGSLTIFNGPNTVYTINGTNYVGAPGIDALSQTSAGTTMTTAYTTFQPTTTPTGTAGIFNSVYVLAGTSVETFYTQNLVGTVIARSGDTLTVRGGLVWGSTLSFKTGYVQYENTDSTVLVGPSTVVTADDDPSATGLSAQSISVGQRIDAIGTYSVSSTGVVTMNASAANSGAVRLLSTEAYGPLVTASAGSATIGLQSLDRWPASAFSFTGTGVTAAQDTSAASYHVNTGSTDLSGTAGGTPLWFDGLVNGYGSAPPDFNASTTQTETQVPASLQVSWGTAGTTTPFTGVSSGGFAVDLANAALASATIQIEGESIDLHSLPASPQVVPTATAASNSFAPLFALGNASGGISGFNSFASFVTALNSGVSATTPAISLQARGVYDRSTNTFTADTVDLVL